MQYDPDYIGEKLEALAATTERLSNMLEAFSTELAHVLSQLNKAFDSFGLGVMAALS